MTFTHITKTWNTRQYERPQVDTKTPACKRHDEDMQLAMLVEPDMPRENMLFKCPVKGCTNEAWIK